MSSPIQVSIDASDFAYSSTSGTGSSVANQINAGSAGDCMAWANCPETKRGEFSVDLTGTSFALADTFEWKYSGWPDYLKMVSSLLF